MIQHICYFHFQLQQWWRRWLCQSAHFWLQLLWIWILITPTVALCSFIAHARRFFVLRPFLHYAPFCVSKEANYLERHTLSNSNKMAEKAPINFQFGYVRLLQDECSLILIFLFTCTSDLYALCDSTYLLFSLSVTAVVVKMDMSEYTLLTQVTLNLNSNYTNLLHYAVLLRMRKCLSLRRSLL